MSLGVSWHNLLKTPRAVPTFSQNMFFCIALCGGKGEEGKGESLKIFNIELMLSNDFISTEAPGHVLR